MRPIESRYWPPALAVEVKIAALMFNAFRLTIAERDPGIGSFAACTVRQNGQHRLQLDLGSIVEIARRTSASMPRRRLAALPPPGCAAFL